MARASTGRTFLLALAVGISFGFGTAYLLMSTVWASEPGFAYRKDSHFHAAALEEDVALAEEFGAHSDDEALHKDEDVEAQRLKRAVRVLCWVMTSPANHESKARTVKATWGRRCNLLLFMSTTNDSKLGTVALDVQEGRDHLWAKTKAAFSYVHKHHRNDADWFLKADDDTYVIVENLRYMLAPHDPAEAVYFGCRFKPFAAQGYMSGGAGYVLSGAALDRFMTLGIHDPTKCRQDHSGAEDVEMGKCLEKVGVEAGDSRDVLGRGRFFPFVPEHHLIPGHVDKDFWYWKYIYYNTKEGLECCSDSAVSFHYVSPNLMFVLEYLIYHLRPYGISHQISDPAKDMTATEAKRTTERQAAARSLGEMASAIVKASDDLKPRAQTKGEKDATVDAKKDVEPVAAGKAAVTANTHKDEDERIHDKSKRTATLRKNEGFVYGNDVNMIKVNDKNSHRKDTIGRGKSKVVEKVVDEDLVKGTELWKLAQKLKKKDEAKRKEADNEEIDTDSRISFENYDSYDKLIGQLANKKFVRKSRDRN